MTLQHVTDLKAPIGDVIDRAAEDGMLIEKDGVYVFTQNAEFSSPSAAAAVVHGGGANGLTAWRDSTGKTLKELEEV